MDFEKLLERLPRNEDGKYILNDECIEQIFKSFFGKEGPNFAQDFMLNGFCGQDVSEIDMSGLSLQYFKAISFDRETKFSKDQIDKLCPDDIIEQGKIFSDVDKLNKNGITGKGTTIAILDSSFDSSREEYNGRVIQHLVFQKVNDKVIARPYNKEDGNGYHGETTTSLAIGKECGVAPEAKIYVFGIDKESWPEGDKQSEEAWTDAQSAMFKYLVEKKLVPDVISISADYETLPDAKAAEKMLINDYKCIIVKSNDFWKNFSLGRSDEKGEIVYDKITEIMYDEGFKYNEKSPIAKRIKDTLEKKEQVITMPFAGRTSIHTGKSGKPVEKYNGSFCGASFAIAQVGGLALLSKQVDKEITAENFFSAVKDASTKSQDGIKVAHASQIVEKVRNRINQKLGKETLGEQENTNEKQNTENEISRQLRSLEKSKDISMEGN